MTTEITNGNDKRKARALKPKSKIIVVSLRPIAHRAKPWKARNTRGSQSS